MLYMIEDAGEALRMSLSLSATYVRGLSSFVI